MQNAEMLYSCSRPGLWDLPSDLLCIAKKSVQKSARGRLASGFLMTFALFQSESSTHEAIPLTIIKPGQALRCFFSLRCFDRMASEAAMFSFCTRIDEGVER